MADGYAATPASGPVTPEPGPVTPEPGPVTPEPGPEPRRQHTRVAIIGAGFGGLGMAIRLQAEGVDDFVILERGDDVGGTWRDNSYPGCACDIPSYLYSFSFAPDSSWTRAYAPQPEIQDYLRRVSAAHNLAPRLRLGHDVRGCAWNEDARRWDIETSQGPWSADVLVAAPGPLSQPRIPRLPGLDTFAGTVFHTSRWRHDHDLTGRRVAVVGTGASSAQVIPAIVDDVAHLTLLQRTPAWVLPYRNRRYGAAERALLARVPALGRARREAIFWARELTLLALRPPRRGGPVEALARRALARQVPDPDLRARLTPDYSLGCKRVLLSSAFYPALARDDVTVAPAAAAVRPGGIVDADGAEHDVDTIIFGTGFRVADNPLVGRIRGRHGRTLGETWRASPGAYLGIGVRGFPNFFLLLGPNTGLGHNSVVVMIEAQVEHVLRALAHLDAAGAAALEPTAAAQTAFVNEVDDAMRDTVWVAGGCRSWYLDPTGRNSALWPGFAAGYRRRLRGFAPADWELTAAAPAAPAAPASAAAPTPTSTPAPGALQV